MPASTMSQQPLTERLALGRVEPGRRFVEQDEPRAAARGRGRRRAASAARATGWSVARRRGPEAHELERPALVGEVDGRDGCTTSASDGTHASPAPTRPAGSRPTVRSSKSSTDCQVRARPRRARWWAGRSLDALAVEVDRPRRGGEAGEPVDEARLARTVRTDEPDDVPGTDLQRHDRRRPGGRRSSTDRSCVSSSTGPIGGGRRAGGRAAARSSTGSSATGAGRRRARPGGRRRRRGRRAGTEMVSCSGGWRRRCRSG